MIDNNLNPAIVFDSDFIFAYFDDTQSTHLKAKELMSKYVDEQTMISNLVEQELATVLSKKLNYDYSFRILKDFEQFQSHKIFINPEETEEIWKIFWSYKKKNISFVDCSNIYLAKKYKTKIASFDSFYEEKLLLK